MNKLQQVLAWLTASKIHEGKNYVYFQSKTGEPHTVIEFENKLIVSGNQKGGPIMPFADPTDCLKYIVSLAPIGLVHPGVITGKSK